MSFTYCCLVTQLCLTLFETPWTVAHQVPLSMGFSRQEYWNGLPCPTPRDFPNPRIQLPSPILAGRFFTILTPVAVQSFSHVWLCDPMDCRRPCPSLSPRAYSNMCPLSQWCHQTIVSPDILFSSCLQSFPASGTFPLSWLLSSCGQSISVSASASVLPMNSEGWFPLGLTGWIALQSKGLSRVFSNTTVRKHQSFGAQPSLRSNSHIHDYWKNHGFDYRGLCWHSNVSVF